MENGYPQRGIGDYFCNIDKLKFIEMGCLTSGGKKEEII
jgi:hypothetical protein